MTKNKVSRIVSCFTWSVHEKNKHCFQQPQKWEVSVSWWKKWNKGITVTYNCKRLSVIADISAAPSKSLRSVCISDFMQTTFFYLERFLQKLADDQYSSITKGSIYHIKHMYIQPFTTIVDWSEIRCLMEVSAMFCTCRYCVFTWGGRFSVLTKHRDEEEAASNQWQSM